ncbi:hypothetical protein PCANC_13787 [Puccinia coronata f. sp. avenae]|uniref:Uncharacterized protein n=1 Tax=Puccinia coronata f. sp. avenae TaxID=200324 RepID=A0A2N5V277_9BASI|nr:hypothetical protein PCANC_25739 [Puccinia coronata f. sp. avenae]PLW44110.1 hypothetical protein PCANC_13787 [Puccinia coronata f. sp. avenae]
MRKELMWISQSKYVYNALARVEIHHFKNDQPDDQDYDEENIMIVVTIHDIAIHTTQV